MKLIVLAIAAVLVAGCQPVAGTPQPEPQKLDCDLIFPGPDGR